MSVMTMIKTIKRVHTADVALVKIGEFYHAYGKDACILAYLFDYKLKVIDNGCYTCGFPRKSIAKIQAELEKNLINYILLDRRNNYDVDEVCDNKNLNRYEEFSKKSYSYVKMKEKIDNIYNYFLMNMNKTETMALINQVEELIDNDGREI